MNIIIIKKFITEVNQPPSEYLFMIKFNIPLHIQRKPITKNREKIANMTLSRDMFERTQPDLNFVPYGVTISQANIAQTIGTWKCRVL